MQLIPPSDDPFAQIIGESQAMREVKGLLRKIAASPASTILLRGESGTGKNLIAKAVHDGGQRAAGPFLNITCTALPETLLESELFGHERGAFTDAKRERKGLFELADKGTVFLDEIGDMSQALQVKLLRFLEERALRRVGGSRDIRVDAQVVAATNRDLERAVARGNFRNDLYYRLCVLPVRLPALRDRAGDVELLAEHFIAAFDQQFDKRVRGVSAEALRRLQAYEWPGNVRELRNLIERAVLLADAEVLQARDFVPFPTAHREAGCFELPPDGLDLRRLERDLVAQAVARTGGNLTRAGWLLGLSRDQVRYRLQKFGLAEPSPSDDLMVS